MGLIIWLIGVIVAAVISYLVNELLIKLTKNPKTIYRYGIVIIVFLIVFIAVTLVASPKARDIARAVFASSDDRQCYFSRITAPDGSKNPKDAQAFQIPSNTSVSWEPKTCIMVVQAYQTGVLLDELKGQRSGEVTIQQVGRSGEIEVKIFREGFETASSNIFIAVTP